MKVSTYPCQRKTSKLSEACTELAVPAGCGCHGLGCLLWHVSALVGRTESPAEHRSLVLRADGIRWCPSIA